MGRILNGLGGVLTKSGLELGDLSEESLLEEAADRALLTNFGSQDFRVPFTELLKSVRKDAHLSPVGRHLFRELLLLFLTNRLEIQDAIHRNPQILEERIERPLFVIGLARSGTTYLFDLLTQDPAARALRFWEVQHPAPPRHSYQGEDPRIADTEGFIRKYARLTTWAAANVAHKFQTQTPEECTWLLKTTFVCRAFGAWARVPSYMEWHQSEGYARLNGVYAEYKRMLQLLQWQRSGSHLVLKSPSHLWYVDGIVSNFPDARIVQTHRNLLDVVGSHCSLIALARYMYSDRVDLKEIGSFVLGNIEDGLQRMMAVRKKASTAQFMDVRYDDFVRDPSATVKKIYETLGYPLTPELEAKLKSGKTGRSKDGSHTYNLEQFGLHAAMIRDRFAEYSKTFGLEPDNL